MAKAKAKKGSGGGVNSHVRARINYLHKAATYLQSAKTIPSEAVKDREDEVMADSARIVPFVSPNEPDTRNRAEYHPQLARMCISQMRGVSQKSQLRLPIEQKRSFCKRCDTLLIPGTNCTQETRNPSRGARKPWAEVRVVHCNICNTEKRFPQTDRRSRKLSERRKDREPENQSDAAKPT
ncbi:RNAse P Rpr2/Rpp21/SNM1 subunit domain-containing protein [Aspergillus varians]